MKLQTYELPIGKQPQTRRRTPKIAPLLLILTFCLTIIPIYYPSLRYNLKKLTEPASNSFDSIISPIDQSISKIEEKAIFEEAAGKIDESTAGKSYPVSNTDDKLELGIGNELSRSDESNEETISQPITDEKVETGIVYESKRDESTESNEYRKLEPGIVNESKEDESLKSNADEKVESGIVHELRRDEATEVRKRTGRKGRRRSSHRKKYPEIRKAQHQPEHKNPGSTTSTGTTNNEMESKVRVKENSISSLSSSSSSCDLLTEECHRKQDPEIRTGEIEPQHEHNGSNIIIKENPISSSSSSSSCDLFTGEWIPNPEGPYYTNETCWAIQEHQNCMKFGRPDTQYLQWRWKPDECELPIFDPSQFLQLVRGKSLAFVGDSVARNHMQSLICLLSRVVYPEDLSKSINDQNRLYFYKDYNFNISMFWSPYLIKTELTEPGNVTRPFNLYLDEFDQNWTTQISHHNYIVISAGQWFMRPTYFYEKQKIVGCLYCPSSDNVPYKTSYFSYRRAFRTSLKAINSLENFKGVTFMRTFAPSHFEGGAWDKNGKCSRTRPFKRNETVLEDYAEKMYKIQLEELDIAKREGRKRKRLNNKFRLFDSTKSMLLRPDGHPSKYGHWPEQKVELPEDCVHWCLPGPIDSWNDFLLELLKREEQEIARQ